MAKRNEKTSNTTLYIIGNGFDKHHDISSSYYDFQDWIKAQSKKDIRFAFTIQQLERFFNAKAKLWSNFEHNIGKYDTNVVAIQRWGLFPEFLTIETMEMVKDVVVSSGFNCLGSLSETLTSVFRRWVPTINTDKKPDNDLNLSNSALYLTFNYTDTLERLYNISPDNILHIHGSVLTPEKPFIVGHNNYIDPLSVVIEGNDFRDNNERIDRICEMNGLIKPCYDIIERNSSFFDRLKQVNSVIVMGHSYSDIDLPYFKKVKSSVLPEATWKMGWHTAKDISETYIYQKELKLSDSQILRFEF